MLRPRPTDLVTLEVRKDLLRASVLILEMIDHHSPDLQLHSLTWFSVNTSSVSFWRILVHLQEYT